MRNPSRASSTTPLQRHLMVVVCCLLAAFASLCVPSTSHATPELMRAYKKEFAFLQAQKRAMRKRLEVLKAQQKKRIAAAESALRRMQQQVMSRREAADTIARRLQGVVQVQSQHDERKALMDKVLGRATLALQQGGLKLRAGQRENAGKKLQEIFVKGAVLMKRLSTRTERQGAFFLPDGTRTEGKIIQLGGIASYGISPQGQGALSPAGAGRLKLWPQDASRTAAALAKGEMPSQLKIFLYENLNKEIAFRAEKTLFEFIHAGGLIGWVIVGLGLIAALLVLLRMLVLAWASMGSQRLMSRVEVALQEGKGEEALALAQASRGAGARVLAQTLSHIDKERQQVEELVSESILIESPKIERFGSMITVIAAIAPLLGLLGTVTGMISTFDVITQYGTGDPKLLAGGISEALITTKLGLIVAIPALLLGTLLAGRAEAILHRMEWGALRLMNLAQLQRQSAVTANTGHRRGAFVRPDAPTVGEPPSSPRHIAFQADS